MATGLVLFRNFLAALVKDQLVAFHPFADLKSVFGVTSFIGPEKPLRAGLG